MDLNGRSLGISSNLVFSEWDRIFQNPEATAAPINRIVHHSGILELVSPATGPAPRSSGRVKTTLKRME
ncbi:ATP-binding protein [Dehalogenimonas formicexedens]|uniref:ATP-binding protein n=1 Tax=Dehalogenimonas formicexedens TaxID=1839801 RepID=UPI0009F8CF81